MLVNVSWIFSGLNCGVSYSTGQIPDDFYAASTTLKPPVLCGIETSSEGLRAGTIVPSFTSLSKMELFLHLAFLIEVLGRCRIAWRD